MLNGDLPEDGELRLGSLRLRGRRVGAALSGGQPVAWVTEEPVPDAGSAWLALEPWPQIRACDRSWMCRPSPAAVREKRSTTPWTSLTSAG